MLLQFLIMLLLDYIHRVMDNDKLSSISQLIKGKSRDLRKLLKYFNGTNILMKHSASNLLLSVGTLPESLHKSDFATGVLKIIFFLAGCYPLLKSFTSIQYLIFCHKFRYSSIV